MKHPPIDDATLIADSAHELETYAPMGPLGLRPITAFQLVALVQLALRHPDVPPALRATGDQWIAMVREYFADAPAVLEMITRGSDARYDR